MHALERHAGACAALKSDMQTLASAFAKGFMQAHEELRRRLVIKLVRHCQQVLLRDGQILLEGAEGPAVGGRLVCPLSYCILHCYIATLLLTYLLQKAPHENSPMKIMVV